MKKITATILAILLICFLTSCGESQLKDTSQETQDTSQSSSETNKSTGISNLKDALTVGDTFTSYDISITLDSVNTVMPGEVPEDKPLYTSPEEGSEFLITNWTITNGMADTDYTIAMQESAYVDGQMVNESIDAWVGEARVDTGAVLPPGTSSSGRSFTYVIPADWQVMQIRVKVDPSVYEYATFEIKPDQTTPYQIQ